MQKAGIIFSHLFHPLLMPLYCIALVFSNPNYLSMAVHPGLQMFACIIVFITSYLMPALSALFLLYRGEIRSLQMQSREERTLPFLVTACYFSLCYYLLHKLPMPSIISGILLGAAVAAVLTLLINFKWKISVHMVGIGGVAGVLFALTRIIFADYTYVIVLLVFLAGILGSIRVSLGGHTTSQVYAGFVVGALVEYYVMCLYA